MEQTNPATAANDGKSQDRPAANDSVSPKVDEIDAQGLARAALARATDREQAAAQLGLNVIDAVRVRGIEQHEAASGSKDAPKSLSAEDKEAGLPASLKKKYIATEDKFYFRGRENALAFEDKGKTLATPHNDPEVSRSMVELAQARGWTSMKVAGHDDFKREVWLQASLQGIEVTGYKPKDVDVARLNELREAQKSDNRITQGTEKKTVRAASDPQQGAETPRSTQLEKKLSPADQVAEVARKAAQEKGYSPQAQRVIADKTRERVADLQKSGKVVSMVKYDQSAQRETKQGPVIAQSKQERSARER